ncbi:hypothetical protein [Mucisphaera calidilacus]|uniref:Uncharacterized protein n=1 Tax=Mucisphaera calidilacus TaxID=2527982 RepID=A0A518C0L0_9BACT|nr:hypothetical protein [Mucisphaera calidilacus]QDU72763.1 hypothetical protein Pan265_26370 [Mucisphaera calidilacus]
MYTVRCPFCKDDLSLPFVRLGAARRCPSCGKASRIQLAHIVAQPDGSTLRQKENVIPQVPSPVVTPRAESATVAATANPRRRRFLGYLGLSLGVAILCAGAMFVTTFPHEKPPTRIIVEAWNSAVAYHPSTQPAWVGEAKVIEDQGRFVLLLPQEAITQLNAIRKPAYVVIRPQQPGDNPTHWEAQLPAPAGKPIEIQLDAQPGTAYSVALFAEADSP